MSYRVLWSDAALARTTEFFDFIAEDNPEAARRAVEALFDRVAGLAEHPHLGRPLLGDVGTSLRRLVAGKYVVVYEIREATQEVTVVAVRHGRERSLPYEDSGR